MPDSKLQKVEPRVSLFRKIKRSIKKLILVLPYFAFIKDTESQIAGYTFSHWFNQRILGYNRDAYWGVHKNSIVTGAKNIYIGIGTAPGYMPGCYIQAFDGKIYIDDYTIIAANVAIISANHLLTDSRKHEPSEVRIGKYCWLGFGCVVLPGVTLGDYTVVGANAVVTRSFPEGYCVIGGNPAKIIKHIDKDECVFYKNEVEYHGYIKAEDFEEFRRKNLTV